MPLLFPESQQTPESVLKSIPESTSAAKPHFLVFLSSVDPATGEMWCPDCRNPQQLIEQIVPEQASQLVFVGDRTSWKSPDSPWRKAPFHLSAIPTVIKVEQSPNSQDSLESSLKSGPRLIEGDLMDEAKFKQFVASS
ncbi:uncharacterized protein JCM15063_005359 [Sporobolomyces koalae]|uniref:uncharacterized protein n=1 Tax=Sporobolomyces koalae TaxID=500713 RepID=UPI00316BE085